MKVENRTARNPFARRPFSRAVSILAAATLVASLVPSAAFATAGSAAPEGRAAGVALTVQAQDFAPEVASAVWRSKKVLDIVFGQPIAAIDKSQVKLNTMLGEYAFPEADAIDIAGNTATITFASYSASNVYGVIFGPGSLQALDGSANAQSITAAGLEGPYKTIAKLAYSPATLPAAGGKVVATLEGANLNDEGWPKPILYMNGQKVKDLDNNQCYDAVRQTVTFTLPANTGVEPRSYSLQFEASNFSAQPIVIEEGADAAVVVAGAAQAATPQVTALAYSATDFKAEGGEVTVDVRGQALTQLKPEDLQLAKDGVDAGVAIGYRALEDTAATITFTLPANISASDDVYTLSIARGAQGVAGNPQTLTVRPANYDALVEGIDYIDRGLNPYHYGAGDFTLFYTGGTIKANLSGENLGKLTAADFVLEVERDGAFVLVDGQITIVCADDAAAQVRFSIPENTDILAAKTYRFTVLKAVAGTEGAVREFTVDRPEERIDDTKFQIAAPKWGASMADAGLVRIWISEPKAKLNPGFADGTLDVADYIFFSDSNDAPYAGIRNLTAADQVYMQDDAIFIKLADAQAAVPNYVVFKPESLVSGAKKLSVYDEFKKLYHKRYVNQGAHIESIAYDQVTFTHEGGHVHAVIDGTQLGQSTPALWGKVLIDSEKDYSREIVPTVKLSADGLSATVDFDVPANTTGRTISYRFIPVIDGANVAPTYLRGYDVVSVLPVGGKQTDVTVSSVELQGDGDLDDRLDVLTTSTSEEEFTSKIYVTLRGTNLSSRRTAVKAVDENGVVWPTLPVFECGATIRWQSSATYMPEKESANEQTIELLPPRRLGVPHTFTLYFAPDGANYLDEPVGTVILDNQGLFDYEDMANRKFEQKDLTDLIQVKVKYVDEAGKPLAPADALAGYGITEMYHQSIAAKSIAGYTLKATTPNNLAQMMSQPVVHSTGEYIFEHGQFFFRDLKGTVSPAGALEPYTVFFIYAKDVDKTALEKSVKAAQEVGRGVKTSVDGTDVDASAFYVTPVEADQLATALANAQTVLDNPKATQAAIDGAQKRLDAAVKAYASAKKPGRKPAPGKADPAKQMSADGTAVGAGASAAAAEKAILSAKSDEGPAGTVFGKVRLRSTKQAKGSITLKWAKVKGAKKYVVYAGACGKKGMKKAAALGAGKASYVLKKALGKKLSKGRYYKAMVVALDAKGDVVSASKVVHAATLGGKAANPGKVTTRAKKGKVALAKGESFKLAAKQASAAKGKRVSKHRAVKYETSSAKIATVSKKGVIKAKKKGACYVYAYAQNGAFAKVKVTVR